jgi:hypothetical protein
MAVKEAGVVGIYIPEKARIRGIKTNAIWSKRGS